MSSEEISCNCAQLFGFSAAEDGVRPEQEPLKERNTSSDKLPKMKKKLGKVRSVHPSIHFLSPLILLSGWWGRCSLSSPSWGEGGVHPGCFALILVYKQAQMIPS